MRFARIAVTSITLAAAAVAGTASFPAGMPRVAAAPAGTTITINGPAGSGTFGSSVRVLSNGNFVVSDPFFDSAAAADVGAVYLYDGRTNALISTLTGTITGDKVGDRGTVEVGNGNFLVISRSWDAGAVIDAGAVTWVDGTTGLNGSVSATNSLVGTKKDDFGSTSISVLTNGNFAIGFTAWDSAAVVDAGAATWGSGNAPTTGQLSAANSLIGTTAGDNVGATVVPLTNGHYVVATTDWSNGAVADAGAVTWANGNGGTVGLVSPANSLVGTTLNDRVGGHVVALTNGNYVVDSTGWNNGATADVGAVTWRPGTGPTPAAVSPANSLIGATANDFVGFTRALTNGNYVVSTNLWDNGGLTNVGAVTWGNGQSGTTGTVTAANSFVGNVMFDGNQLAVTPLENGNYVVGNPTKDLGVGVDYGAATWLPGGGPSTGSASAANSLVGSFTGDAVGFANALANGNYVVRSPSWDNGTTVNAGAATWASGTGGTVGPVSAANSLVGTQTNEAVGQRIDALTNGNYLAAVIAHDVGSNVDAGAVIWRPGNGPAPTTITAANSIVGSSTNDRVGEYIQTLENGDYVVATYDWDNLDQIDAGAITVASGSAPSPTGAITAANSVVGAKAGDQLGFDVYTFSDSRWATLSPVFDNGALANAGVAIFGLVTGPVTGQPSPETTVLGDVANGGDDLQLADDGVTSRGSFLLGMAAANKVVLFTPVEYVPLAPARLADTRAGMSSVDGLGAATGAVTAGSTLEVVVAGRGGVATDARAATLNVTAVDAVAAGFATVFPCGAERPTASSLNMTPGGTVANAVIATIGAGGKVCVFASQTTEIVVDVNGFFPVTTNLHSANPARVLDTRPGFATIDGQGAGAGKNAGGGVVELQITGRAGVPAGAAAVVLNATISEGEAAGFATLFPCGGNAPLASNLNFVPGVDVANLVVAPIGAGGKVCILTSQAAHVIADVTGYLPVVGGYTALAPARLFDSRPGFDTVDGQGAGAGLRGGGSVTAVQVTGRAGVPSGAAAVVVNVTAVDAAGPGFVTMYPCGIDPPLASNLNVTAGATVPNAAIVKVGAGGAVCLFTSQPAQLVVDVAGYFV